MLHAGRRLRPAGRRLALLPSARLRFRVCRKPRIAILVTGNELLPAGLRCRPAFRLWIATRRCSPHSQPATARAIASGSLRVGSLHRDSRGTACRFRASRRGSCFWRNVGRCGRSHASCGGGVGRTSCARRRGAPGCTLGIAFLSSLLAPHPSLPLFLIPGNPVSCLCAYDLFVGRVIRRLGGRSWELPYRKAVGVLTRRNSVGSWPR